MKIALRILYRLRYLVLLVLALLAVVAAAFWYGQYTVYQSHPSLTVEDQANAILSKVSTLIQLPAGETPQMATINNAASAKAQQPFLKDAEDGDVLIVYAQAGTAILYRPGTDKLVAVGPVQSSNPPNATSPTLPIVQPIATSSSQRTAHESATSTAQ